MAEFRSLECSRCGYTYAQEDVRTHPDGKYWCDTCYDNSGLVRCDDCEGWFAPERMFKVAAARMVCPSCNGARARRRVRWG
jgi:formylmethanofuran dehydrogenase subunit E